MEGVRGWLLLSLNYASGGFYYRFVSLVLAVGAAPERVMRCPRRVGGLLLLALGVSLPRVSLLADLGAAEFFKAGMDLLSRLFY